MSEPIRTSRHRVAADADDRLTQEGLANSEVSPVFGESGVRGDARAETRFHFGTGITRVVPWLLVSGARSAPGPLGRCRGFRAWVGAEALRGRSAIEGAQTRQRRAVRQSADRPQLPELMAQKAREQPRAGDDD
jgi:hypothetical protein